MTSNRGLINRRFNPFYAVWCLIIVVAGPTPAAAAGPQTAVPFGAVWSYLDDGSDQGTAWRAPAFADSSWANGPAELGYGDGDEATVVSFGPNPGNKYITTYFRHTFTLAATESLTLLRLIRDDGCVVYLNGTEVFRSNLPAGAIDYLTTASGAGGSEDEVQETFVDGSLLVVGENVLAVEIHQRGVSSSDVSFDLEYLTGDVPVSLARGPYLQRGTPNELTIRWRTNVPSDGRVWYGLSPGDLSLSTDDASIALDHEVTLTGLTPGTTYYYAVGTTTVQLAGDDANHTFTTAPPVGTTVPTRIWVLGDSGTANTDAEAVRDAYHAFNDSQTNLWLMLGDNAYSDGTDEEYQAAVFDMYPDTLRRSVLWATLGNHDGHSADSPTQSGPYYDIFSLPTNGEAGGLVSGTEAYYSFDYGNIHFICLDSYDTDRAPDAAMMMWLESDLADTLADWIIAFWHHPPYTKGSHDSDSEGRLIDMRMFALPILEAGGVDLVLSGHSHSYERSYLMNGHYETSDMLDEATMIVDGGNGREDGDGAYVKASGAPLMNEGSVYVVAGSSGKTSGGDLDHPVMFVSLNELGSVVIDVDGSRMDVKFVQADDQVADYLTILKQGPASIPIASTWGVILLVLLLVATGCGVVRKRRLIYFP